MKYKLTPAEYATCYAIALARVLAHIAKDSKHAPGYKSLVFDARVSATAESIAAEMVVSRFLSIPWVDSAGSYKNRADVGEIHEVKNTSWDQGQLIISAKDRDGDIAWLVIGEFPKYRIAGYIPVKTARTPRYKHPYQPNHWVHQIDLREPNTFKHSIYNNGPKTEVVK